MSRLAALLVVLAGCDSLFNFDTVPLPAAGDAGGSDALVPPVDVTPCTAGQMTIAVPSITAISAGDLDRSGTSDLAIASTPDPSGDVLVFTGNSGRTFTPGPELHPGTNPIAVAWYARTAADDPDLIVSVRGANTLVEYPNIAGALGPAQPTQTTGLTPGLAIANLDGDGVADVIVATDSQLLVYFGGSDGFAGSGFIALAGVQSMVAGQLSVEPADDLAASRPVGNETDVVFGAQAGAVTSQPLGMNTATGGVAIGDFTGDQIADVVTALPSGALVVATGPDFMQRVSTAFTAPGPLLAFELTGDDHVDLLVGTANGLWLAPSNGDGTFGTPQPLMTSSSAVLAIAAGDFDGDGHRDIAAATSAQVTALFECQ